MREQLSDLLRLSARVAALEKEVAALRKANEELRTARVAAIL